MERIADALERIADALETMAEAAEAEAAAAKLLNAAMGGGARAESDNPGLRLQREMAGR